MIERIKEKKGIGVKAVYEGKQFGKYQPYNRRIDTGEPIIPASETIERHLDWMEEELRKELAARGMKV